MVASINISYIILYHSRIIKHTDDKFSTSELPGAHPVRDLQTNIKPPKSRLRTDELLTQLFVLAIRTILSFTVV